jgi:hypothetical protein
MAEPRQIPALGGLVLGVACSLMGAFMVLLALGHFGRPLLAEGTPPWVGVLGGVVFLLGGLALIVGFVVAGGTPGSSDLPPGTPFGVRLVQYLLGLGITTSLALIASWVAFGPGPRRFQGTGTFGGFVVGETFGRAVFGFGAVLVWLFVALLSVIGLRRLGRK